MSFLRSGSIGGGAIVPDAAWEPSAPDAPLETRQVEVPLGNCEYDAEILGEAPTTLLHTGENVDDPVLDDFARGVCEARGSTRDHSPLFLVPYVCGEIARLLCDVALHVVLHEGSEREAATMVGRVVERTRHLVGEGASGRAVGLFLARQLWPAAVLLHAPHMNPDAVGALTSLVDLALRRHTGAASLECPMARALANIDDDEPHILPQGLDVEDALRSARRTMLGVSEWVPDRTQPTQKHGTRSKRRVRRYVARRVQDLSMHDVPPCARRAAILGNTAHYKNEDRMTVPNFYADAGFDIEDIGSALAAKMEAVQLRNNDVNPKRVKDIWYTAQHYDQAMQRKVDEGWPRPRVLPSCKFFIKKADDDAASVNRRQFHCPFAVALNRARAAPGPEGEAAAAKQLRDETDLVMDPVEAMRIAARRAPQMACVAEWRASNIDVEGAQEMDVTIFHPTDYVFRRAEAIRMRHKKQDTTGE